MGTVAKVESGTDVVITLDADGAAIRIENSANAEIARMGVLPSPSPTLPFLRPTGLRLNDAGGKSIITLNATSGDARLGGNGQDGKLVLLHSNNDAAVVLDGKTGLLELRDAAGQTTVTIRAVQGADASIIVGGDNTVNRRGWIVVRSPAGTDAAFLSGEVDGGGLLELRDAAGHTTVMIRAVQGADASIIVGGDNTVNRRGWIVVRSPAGTDAAFLSGEVDGGVLELRDETGTPMIRLRAASGAGRFGGRGVDGDLLVFSKNAPNQDNDHASVWIQGGEGDIVLRNADCAEEFDVHGTGEVQAGMVVVLHPDGGLHVADRPYDRRVAGVISGGDGLHPGIVLGRVPGAAGRWPVALAGRVSCKVDASFGPVGVGEFLTTSPTPGHAMAATDQGRSFGAVLGKAMAPLISGTGMVPVLVTLQ